MCFYVLLLLLPKLDHNLQSLPQVNSKQPEFTDATALHTKTEAAGIAPHTVAGAVTEPLSTVIIIIIINSHTQPDTYVELKCFL